MNRFKTGISVGKLVSKPGDSFAKWVFSSPLKLPGGDINALEIYPGNEMEITGALFGGTMSQLGVVMREQARHPDDFRMLVFARREDDVLTTFEIDRFIVLVLQERELS